MQRCDHCHQEIEQSFWDRVADRRDIWEQSYGMLKGHLDEDEVPEFGDVLGAALFLAGDTTDVE